MPLDALFSNRSSLEFDDTFPMTRDVNWREVMANMFECSNIQKFKYAIGIDGF